jgi:hypothetical protein
MSTRFIRGLRFVRLVLFAEKDRNSENRIAQEMRIREFEREIQQVKDKILKQYP